MTSSRCPDASPFLWNGDDRNVFATTSASISYERFCPPLTIRALGEERQNRMHLRTKGMLSFSNSDLVIVVFLQSFGYVCHFSSSSYRERPKSALFSSASSLLLRTVENHLRRVNPLWRMSQPTWTGLATTFCYSGVALSADATPHRPAESNRLSAGLSLPPAVRFLRPRFSLRRD